MAQNVEQRLIKLYAQRTPAPEAAQLLKVSLNTVYLHYGRIRLRLVLTGYYRDGGLSIDERGFGEEIKSAIRSRRGVREDNIYPQSPEVIDWENEWDARAVQRHIKRIIELTGPLYFETIAVDELIDAYVRFARSELLFLKLSERQGQDDRQGRLAERARTQMLDHRRQYRSLCRRVQRYRRRAGR